MRRLFFAFLFASLLSGPAYSQRGTRSNPSRPRSIELRVRVTLTNDHPITFPVRVQVIVSGAPSNEAFTDDRGEAAFTVGPGSYRVKVSGADIEETTTDNFEVDGFMGVHLEFVRVALKPGSLDQQSTQGSISVVDINVPRKAQKEFDRGADALAKNKLPEAKVKFQAAIALYPRYATAYNYLGLAEIKGGETEAAQAAFGQATQLNDHYAEAYSNLGKVLMQQKKFPQAGEAFLKAVSLNPANPTALTLLAQTQMITGKPDLALANARRAHASTAPHPAFAHLIAAKVLEAQNDTAGALAEYRTFVKESPGSPTAVQVQAGLDRYAKAQSEKSVAAKKPPGSEPASSRIAPATDKPKK